MEKVGPLAGRTPQGGLAKSPEKAPGLKPRGWACSSIVKDTKV